MNRNIIILLLLINVISPLYGQNKDAAMLKPVGWTNDFEHIFTSEQIVFLDSLIKAYKNETTVQIAIVTIDTSLVTKIDLDDYVTELGNAWGVGKREKNNGIIIGISTRMRKVRISNGYGIENKISDNETKKIIDEIMVPEFKQANYFEGTKKALFAIKEKLRTKNKTLQLPLISAINEKFPLNLEKTDLKDENNIVQLNDEKMVKIGSVISNFYFNECNGDSIETYFSVKDVYINTIQLQDSLMTIYMILLKQPAGSLTSKIIFYDNILKTFADSVTDFNIHALYDYNDGKITASNLKQQFKIKNPEIERNNHRAIGAHTYRFTRLYHNGTENAIEIFILKVDKQRIEKAGFKRQSLP